MQSPLLFLVFNRPEPTQRVFQVLRAVRPPRLYVAADGPRSGRPGEAARCEATRRIATEIDWPCELHTLLRTSNLGCKQAVSQAIDWFFEQEPAGIVLEDDCLPDPSFFRFCDELLERYRNDERVGLISGDNFQFGRIRGEASYYFSRYPHIWGWASWQRVWRHYERDARQWPEFRASGGLKRLFGSRTREVRHWTRIFDAVHADKIDTWDYQLTLALWTQRMVSIVPQRNLVSNIGFGAEATHTSHTSNFAAMATQPLEFPLRHPTVLNVCTEADDYTATRMFVQSIPERIMTQLRAVRGRIVAR